MGRSLLRHFASVLALTMIASSAGATSTGGFVSTGMPEGFGELASSRAVLVDVYFGGRKVTEALAVARPGFLRFRAPGDLLAKLGDVTATPELTAALAGDLPTNSEHVCAETNVGDCGMIAPEMVGIIYDEDRFRVDLFVNAAFLRTEKARDGYLPVPSASLSLTNALGLNASGTIGGQSAFNLQNRTIIGLHNARLRADTSIASGLGLVVDDLAAELDRKNLRYSAGMFWAPGNEFIGERRIIGAGVGTQFDTWLDQERLHGTPLIVFLPQPGRVEILVDGRLMSSRTYAAGNMELDTSELPQGSYPVLLRIREPSGAVHEEQRFFIKNAQVPPSGHPIFFAYAGVLANTRRHQPISPSGTLYYQLGAAWRLTNSVALDVTSLGTQHKAIVQAGAWLIEGPARIRGAGLYSSAGDWGALLQASTAGRGPLNVSFDLRRIWSHDGQPLVPLPTFASGFDSNPPTGVQLATGSYTQATASIGLQLGRAYLSVVGSYRKDRHLAADYTLGPSLNWPVITRNQIQVVFEASAQRSRTATAAFAGFRVLFNSGRLSLLSTVGHGFQSGDAAGIPSISRSVGTFTGQYSYQTEQSQLNLAAGVDRNVTSSTMHASGMFEGPVGNVRADLLHNLERDRTTQYDVAFQSGVAIGAGGAELGGRNLEQSALIITLDGDAKDGIFNVLVNDVPKARAQVGKRLLLFLPPYRTYDVRLVPVAATAVDYDTAARKITLYPGNVQSLAWHAQSYFTIFGQAVSARGDPIGDALVQSAKSIAQSDSNGYFQLDVRRGDSITVAKGDRPSCRIHVGNVPVKDDFASVGKVVCE